MRLKEIGTSLNRIHNQGIYIPNLEYNVHCVNLKYLIEIAAKKIEVFFHFPLFSVDMAWRLSTDEQFACEM